MGANLDPVVAAQADVACASYVNFTASTSSIVASPMEIVAERFKIEEITTKRRLERKGNATGGLQAHSTIVGFLAFFFFFFSLFSLLFFPFEKGTVVRCTYGESLLVWAQRERLDRGFIDLVSYLTLWVLVLQLRRSETTIKLAGTARFGL